MTTLADAQAAGFLLGGEPLALDLANTLITATEPPTDLLEPAERLGAFWALQDERLPAGWSVPGVEEVRALREAVKALVSARLAGEAMPAAALARVNQVAAAAAVSPRLGAGWEREEAWRAPDGGALALAAVAGSAIALLSSEQASRLRRCANHEGCSLVFVATDERRKWCAPNLCGNRTRVARHYQRHRKD